MKRINSRAKGSRGERALVKYLLHLGFEGFRRGQQYAGGPESPDVTGCEELDLVLIECKFGVKGLDLGTKLLEDACRQAERDARGRSWCVMWKPGGKCWRMTFRNDSDVMVTVTGDANIRACLLGLATRAKRRAA